MLRRSLLRRVCPYGQHNMLLPESAVRPVWAYGARRPVEVSRLASACRAFSLSGLPRVSVGAHRHGVCGHPHRCHYLLTWGNGLGGRYEYSGHWTAYSTDSCHPVHVKPATWTTGRLPPTPGEACHPRSAATLGRLLLFCGRSSCQPRLPFPHGFALQGDLVCVMDQAVKDRVGQRRIT